MKTLRCMYVLFAAVFIVGGVGCNDAPVGLSPREWPLGVVVDIPLETYEGSGQVVHPTVVSFGNYFWESITPYPFGDAEKENPSIFVSENGLDWFIPRGVSNPIVMPSPEVDGLLYGDALADLLNSRSTHDVGVSQRVGRDPGEPSNHENGELSLSPPYETGIGGGYLSDPDLLYNPSSGNLELYFRQYVQSQREDVIFRMETSDGIRWSAPQEILRGGRASILSPAIIIRNGQQEMFSVNGGPGCGTQNTRVERRRSQGGNWSEGEAVSLSQPGFIIWHIEVDYIASIGEYFALYNAYPEGNGDCGQGSLFLARSRDGVTWITFSNPVLAPGETEQFSHGVYRSTFLYEPESDEITIWFSGSNRRNRWSKAGARYKLTELLSRLGSRH